MAIFFSMVVGGSGGGGGFGGYPSGGAAVVQKHIYGKGRNHHEKFVFFFSNLKMSQLILINKNLSFLWTVHVPPPEPEEVIPQRQIPVQQAQKHYKIIFIKGKKDSYQKWHQTYLWKMHKSQEKD